MRKKIRRVCLLILVLAVLGSYTMNVGAAAQANDTSSLSLNLEQSIDKALKYTHKLDEIDLTTKELWKQQNDLMVLSKSIQDQLDSIDAYTKLYEKKRSGE